MSKRSFVIVALLSASCSREEPKLAAIAELAEQCEVPNQLLIDYYRRHQRHREYLANKGANLRDEGQLIYLGQSISDQRLLDKDRCIKTFKSQKAFWFNFHAVSPTEI